MIRVQQKTREFFIYLGLFVLALLLFVLVLRFGTYNVGKENPNVEFGVTFSVLRARELGLDWKKAYLATLDDLRVKLIRVPIYWTDVETREGEYTFEDYHWMFREARGRDVSVIPVIGMRVPRWPECHVPEWAGVKNQESRIKNQEHNSPQPASPKLQRGEPSLILREGEAKDSPLKIRGDERGVMRNQSGETTASFVTRDQEEYNRHLQLKILELLEKEIQEFKEYPNILYWQVENEPLLGTFGACPFHDLDFYRQEIEWVRRLDPWHKVMATDPGELSSWIELADASDVLGVSVYRKVFNKYLGFFYYPFPPLYYQKKAELVSHLADRVVISELQSEPWIEGSISEASLDDQIENFPLSRLKDTSTFAKKTGLSPILLWGTEWWYDMKEQNRPEYWNYAKTLFRKEN